MTIQTVPPVEEFDPSIHYKVRSTSSYSFEELADIYNQTRVDYIVPMPMNAKRMREYVTEHDVDLDASVVVLSEHDEVIGLNMVAFRQQRAWITRLGVVPDLRKRKSGQFLMDTLLERARQRGAKWVQLEVIEGNEPAYRLFLKCGFKETRRLLIIRRPPGMPAEVPARAEDTVTPLSADEINACLSQRDDSPAWLEETPSLLHTGSLKGLRVTLASGKTGWVVYQLTTFKIAHIVLCPYVDEELASAVLYHLHRTHPRQDTKTENVPVSSVYWPIFQKMGYLEEFRRIEMLLKLSDE